MAYVLTFWGTRGSIPSPGGLTARYGGNTPCVSVEYKGGDGSRLLVLDAGTGIRMLGKQLQERGRSEVEVDLLLSHTHWDHIQGLPFFAPLFGGSNAVRVWGPKQGDVALESILRRQMEPVVFPVPLDGLAAQLTVQHIEGESLAIGDFDVSTIRLRHPGNTLGYRLTPKAGGSSLAYVTDNELGPGGEYEVGPGWRADFVRFLRGADVLVHDSMFTGTELNQHRGWGHSSFEEAVALAVEAEVKHLVLFHHRPERDDAAMDELLDAARQMGQAAQKPLAVSAAIEGTELTLDGG
ncbi:MAG: MBL fold metallo-hydrolase [Gemmatimonadota bacterium]|nr:MAG: MBL fold metallo-hydrolase [Gemmatimonadota bacterium]